MKYKHVAQVLCIAAAASALVWTATMAIGGRQPGPQMAGAEQKAPKAVIADALREVEASYEGPLGSVSNPYVIVERSPALDRVIELGTPALPELISEIENGPSDGNEFLLAICASRIIKAHVGGSPGTDTFWCTGKDFPPVWRSYLARIPERVASIAGTNGPSAEKNAQLVKLGTPALPFILDEVEAGHGELSVASEILAEGTVEMGGSSVKGLVTAKWAKENKARFNQLRDMVSEAK